MYNSLLYCRSSLSPQIARFTRPIWGPPGSCRPQMGPILAPWTLLSGAQSIITRYFTWNNNGNIDQDLNSLNTIYPALTGELSMSFVSTLELDDRGVDIFNSNSNTLHYMSLIIEQYRDYKYQLFSAWLCLLLEITKFLAITTTNVIL